ncbi:MAG: PDC sensor domain-containing protein [Actinobacteria bacterium]|nr:PDC sensor domain-containing protein [Actinomycetota bacterium]
MTARPVPLTAGQPGRPRADGPARLLADITARIGQVVASVTGIRDVVAAIAGQARPAGRPLCHADLAPVRQAAAQVLAAHRGFVAGAGAVLAPGVVADAARCLEWWWATPAGEVSKLAVDLDPDSAECYDYTATPWYREPERTGAAAVTGPYVDYICTREYTFTVSVPVPAGRRFAGVAGADILAEEVERLALPALARLPQAAALVSGDGRVIASNTSSLLPGSILPSEQARPAACHPALPWRLVSPG